MARFLRLALTLLLLMAPEAPVFAQATVGGRDLGPSGLPLPRFASLASGEVNVRTGPSTDHPIRWVYARAGLPVRVVEEFDVWRRIEDPDGETGWTRANLLSVRRTAMVRGEAMLDLRRSAAADARVVAQVEPGIVAEFQGCEANWCQIEVEGARGWLPRDRLWGVAAED